MPMANYNCIASTIIATATTTTIIIIIIMISKVINIKLFIKFIIIDI